MQRSSVQNFESSHSPCESHDVDGHVWPNSAGDANRTITAEATTIKTQLLFLNMCYPPRRTCGSQRPLIQVQVVECIPMQWFRQDEIPARGEKSTCGAGGLFKLLPESVAWGSSLGKAKRAT